MNGCNKHAYLIMVHHQPQLLKKLLILLDDARNDIYIHVDKKMKDFKKEEFEGLLKNSRVYWTERTNVKWGGYSQINCELLLLKEAIKCEHSYYHLISGADLPIKSQNEIHDFFEKYDGLEFVHEDLPDINEGVLDRIKYYHVLSGRKGIVGLYIKSISLKIQKLLKIDRLKKYPDIYFQKGRNWFSITHEFAQYVVAQEKWIKSVFNRSVCADELFLQTVARNSLFRDKICNHNTMPDVPDTRYIDWKRGEPYTFRSEDYDELMNAEGLFARKFDINLDARIVNRIFNDLR